MILYGLKTCGTVKKARKWLDERKISYDYREIRETPPSPAELDQLVATDLPAGRLFNTSGGSYRKGGFKDKVKSMSRADIAVALGSDPMLIKRPFIIKDDFILIGFKEAEFEAQFSN